MTDENTKRSHPQKPSRRINMNSPGPKFILIGVITILLLVPTLLVWGLVEERSSNAERVSAEIARGWGGPQTVNGPFLVVPFTVETNRKTNNGRDSIFTIRFAIFSPASLDINSDIDVNERRKSIYKSQLYHVKSAMAGRFDGVTLKKIRDLRGRPLLDRAFMAIGISDVTGFRSDVIAQFNGRSTKLFRPGLNGLRFDPLARAQKKVSYGGVHLPVSQLLVESGFEFEINMAFNGSQNFSVIPAGRSTTLSAISNWPHPGFDGRFLPESRTITDTGFEAQWTVPNLARGIDSVSISSKLPAADTKLRVNFIEPLKFYQITARSLKYSIAVLSLVFLIVFVLEMTGKSSIHWIQYILVGLACVIFYVLLLALSEQVGFGLAYTISALATTGLVAWYVGDALRSRKRMSLVASMLSIVYLILYLVLNEDEFALLAGSLIAFTSIAATMYATRNVDWSGTTNESK